MLYIGTAGVPISARKRSSLGGIERVAELGLDAMELEFVRGIRMSPELARQAGTLAKKLGVVLTVHGPYYINLNSKDRSKLAASKRMVLDSARIGWLASARSVTFHPGYYGGMSPEEAFEQVKSAVIDILQRLKKEKIKIKISPETTGKVSAFGSFEELVKLAKEIDGLGLCIDFAHLHARTNGKLNSKEEWIWMFHHLKKQLGKDALKDLHMHISGIAYTEKGEKHHLNLPQSDLRYKELCAVLKKFKIGGILISESPNLEGDALLLKKILRK